MAKATQTVLENRLGSIKRGAYWFGIIGRLSMIFGFLILVFAAVSMYLESMVQVNSAVGGAAMHLTHSKQTMEGYGQGLEALLYGWLFLLGRDAFEAVEALIKEMQEIV